MTANAWKAYPPIRGADTIAFSSDSHWFAVSGEKIGARLGATATPTVLRRLGSARAPLLFSPDNQRIAALAGKAPRTALFDVPTGRPIGGGWTGTPVAFGKDALSILLITSRGLELWDGGKRRTLVPHKPGSVSPLAGAGRWWIVRRAWNEPGMFAGGHDLEKTLAVDCHSGRVVELPSVLDSAGPRFDRRVAGGVDVRRGRWMAVVVSDDAMEQLSAEDAGHWPTYIRREAWRLDTGKAEASQGWELDWRTAWSADIAPETGALCVLVGPAPRFYENPPKDRATPPWERVRCDGATLRETERTALPAVTQAVAAALCFGGGASVALVVPSGEVRIFMGPALSEATTVKLSAPALPGPDGLRAAPDGRTLACRTKAGIALIRRVQ